MINLDTPVNQLDRIGKQLSGRLQKLGIETVRDLIFYFPFRHEDFSRLSNIADLHPGDQVTVRGRLDLIANKRSFRSRKIITEAILSDDSGSIKMVWFNQPWVGRSLKNGDELLVFGKTQGDWVNCYFNSPNYEKFEPNRFAGEGNIFPVYSTTDGLSQKQLRTIIKNALKYGLKQVIEYLPAQVLSQARLAGITEAIQEIHYPLSKYKLDVAKKRLAFDELFLIQLWSQSVKAQLKKESAVVLSFQPDKIKNLIDSLPFDLTFDQKKAAWEIVQDLEKNQPMNRLLQGDVGSGKTLVAVVALYSVALNRHQAVFMAPTEILALQHYQSISKLLLPRGVTIGLATRTQKLFNGQKLLAKEFWQKSSAGEIDIIIGTHSLIQKEAQFDRLALAIIDEQQRFGVKQRQALKQKSRLLPHFLSLSATPIPRSLALVIYGDLDLSIISQMPIGRKKIITKIVAPENRKLAYEFIEKQIKSGRQIFVICPLIDASDRLGVRSVTEEFKKLDQQVFPHRKVGLLHGRLKAIDKEQVIADFRDNKLNILVATSVIEVGVDVPNASVMMIEGAERFGLAQLHQFRGRVGRGEHQSYCFLFSDTGDSVTFERLNTLVDCYDGFELAEKDLSLRGSGNVYGSEQSGFINSLKVADWHDFELIKKTKALAEEFIKNNDLADFPLLQEKINQLDLFSHLE